MSLLCYKEIQQSYNKYIVPFAKYCTGTWEDEINENKNHYKIYFSSLLFSDVIIRYKNGIGKLLFAGTGDYTRHLCSADLHSNFAHVCYIVPRRIRRFSNGREPYMEYWREG